MRTVCALSAAVRLAAGHIVYTRSIGHGNSKPQHQTRQSCADQRTGEYIGRVVQP